VQVADLFASLGLRMNAGQWSAGTAAINRLTTGLQRVVAIAAAYQGVRWLAGLVEGVEDAAVGADHMAQRLGVSTDAVQELGYAASRSGSSADELQVGMQHLAKGLEEAHRTGTGPFVDALGKLKLSLNDPAIKSNDLDKMLMEIADRFADMPQGAEKTALAMELFGRSGTTLIPLLNKGADGIGELRREAERLGVVINEQDIRALEELRGEQKLLSGALTGLRNQIAIALVPAMRKAVSAISEWVMANRAWLKEKIVRAIDLLSSAFGVLVRAISVAYDMIKTVTDALERLFPTIDGLKTLLVAAGIAMAAAWIAALGPIELIAVGILALILIAQDLYHSIKDGDGVFADLWRTLEKGHPWLKAVADAMGSVADFVGDAARKMWDLDKAIGAVAHRGERVKRQKEYDTGNEESFAIGQRIQTLSDLRNSMLATGQTEMANGAGGKWTLDSLMTQMEDLTKRQQAIMAERDEAHASMQDLDKRYGDGQTEFSPSSLARRASFRLDPWASPPPMGADSSGAAHLSAPLTLNVTVNGASGGTPDVVGPFKDAIVDAFDEHVRNIQGVVQGSKR
jgi:hypothetical protein